MKTQISGKSGDDVAAPILINQLGISGEGDGFAASEPGQSAVVTAPAQDAVTAIEGTGVPALVFDVSDLLDYFPDNRAPTGIQRVQMEVITSLLKQRVPIRLCCFLPEKTRWAQVPPTSFLAVCNASREGGDTSAASWRATYQGLRTAVDAAAAPAFGRETVIVNLGSSWWLADYFLQIRALKAAYGISYIPLIHDVIPAKRPQFCAPELVAEFIPWIGQVLANADHFLANSRATKADLLDLARGIGRTLNADDVDVIALDADYRDASVQADVHSFPPINRPYVLMVSTFELRKNQLGALAAWRQLINEKGPDVPQLVLVGKRGFKGNDVHERVANDATLASRVTLLEGLDDAELATLYRNSLFALYPSHYEGWGLPVTEALCYGKVPLVADNSSLPEAGGAYAVYFESESPLDLLEKAKRLIFDAGFRGEREQRISSGFAPRSWEQITIDIQSNIARWFEGAASREAYQASAAEIGTYYPLARRRFSAVWAGMGTAEHFRHGNGWWEQEDWGCWTRPGGGRLRMALDPRSRTELAILVRSPDPAGGACVIRLEDAVVSASEHVPHEGGRWMFVPLPNGSSMVDLLISPGKVADIPGEWRKLGVGVRAFFVLPAGDARARREFVEAVALGSLGDFSAYRRRESQAPAVPAA